MEIIVFTISGATFKFKNVKDFKQITNDFSFTYVCVATNIKRKASFDYLSAADYVTV